MIDQNLRIAGVVDESIVDGPGIRFVIFTQGCPHHCPGCHNPQTHPFEGGVERDVTEMMGRIKMDPLISGVTFSGGEPFSQAEALYELGTRLKQRGYNLMCYSGWTFEELLKKAETDEFVGKLLGILDTLVDGRFELSRRSLTLKFRGSTNQRILDVKKSLAAHNAIEAEC